jgi:poly(glycerol-phosphate) alpha-glucosyltransferase
MRQELLDRVETVIIVQNMSMVRNGILNSVLRKVKIMEDEWNYYPLVVAAEYNINLKWVDLNLKYGDHTGDQIHLNQNSRVLGVYNHFQESYPDGAVEMDYGLSQNPDETYKPIGHNMFQVYRGETHVRDEYYIGLGGKLRLVNRYEAGKKQKSIYYDDCGCVSMIQVYDADNPSYHPFEYYYTPDRVCRLRHEYDCTDGENQLKKITLLDGSGHGGREFTSNVELAAHCLDQVLSDENKCYFLIDEAGLYTKTPLLVQKKNVMKACVVHNIFLENPYDLNSAPQRFYRALCEDRNRYDAIIFLTMKERADFIRKYPDFDFRKAFVIPHPYPITRADFDSRDRKKAVLVARYDPYKRIDHAIKIMKLVNHVLPDVRLEIYGFGSNEQEYRELIQKLELEDTVLLKGFTNDPASIFRGALFSMMTSSAEGLPLTLMESICNGCPVFAYDIKYGPSDVILNGVTGYLFDKSDWESYARTMIAFFQDENAQRQFSENCYEDAWRFSKEKFLDRWSDCMEAVYARHLEKQRKVWAVWASKSVSV